MIKPKLALIPAAQGSKLYSVLPSNGVGDFDFTRGSAATIVNKYGLIETVGSGVSRLNYPMIDGVVKGCPHHILEPSRLQLIQYSEDASQWINTSVTISPNNTISPNGTLNADKFEFTGDGSIRPNTSQLTFTNDYSFSIFIKKGNSRYVTLAASFFSSSLVVGFDLDTETSQSGGIIENYGNDWYRLSLSNNVTGDADRTGVFYVYLPNSLGAESSVSGNNAYVWGAQVEESSYATSYIPSNGTTVTRSAETANGSGDATTFNDSEGVLMAEISALDESGGNREITLSDGTTSNRIIVQYRDSSNIRIILAKSTGDEFDTGVIPFNTIQINKIAVKYKTNDFAFWVNGIEIYSDNTGNTFSNGTLSKINFDGGTGGNDFYGNTKQLQYFDSSLNDSDLETLTSWTSFTDMANGQLYTIE